MHYKNVKGILSPDNGMNLYRGCQHGCIYCDARSRCYRMNHAFEDIEIKANAIELLEQALKRKRKKCMISTGAMSDPYIPLEEKLQHTRRSLEIIEKYGFGAVLHTKSSRVLRDLDLLTQINSNTKCVVQMTLTTFDERLCRLIEPNVSTTAERVKTLEILRDNGIPTVVWLTPILPFINDTEENINGIIDYCIKAKVYGIICFDMGLTLRDGNREYFYAALDRSFPGLKEKYIRTYGQRYDLPSPGNKKLMDLLHKRCSECGIKTDIDEIFAYLHKFDDKQAGSQLSLFDI